MNGTSILLLVLAVAAFAFLAPSIGVSTVTGTVSQSKIQQFAQAISIAEGFDIAGSIPNRANNPGDLEDVGQSYPGDTGQRIGQNIIVFDTASNGWNALYQETAIILNGETHWSTDMTIQQVGAAYADDPNNWPVNVATQLGVTTDTTVGDWLNS